MTCEHNKTKETENWTEMCIGERVSVRGVKLKYAFKDKYSN